MLELIIMWISPDGRDKIVCGGVYETDDAEVVEREARLICAMKREQSLENCWDWPSSMVEFEPDVVKIKRVKSK